MRHVLIITLDSPSPFKKGYFLYDYGFPRTAVLLANYINAWGCKQAFRSAIFNVDLAFQHIEPNEKDGSIEASDHIMHKVLEESLARKLNERDFELICIVAPYSNLAKLVLQVSGICRGLKPESVIITGGPHATYVNMFEKYPAIPLDAVILGPGEDKLKHILENFDNPAVRFDHPGISTPQHPVKFDPNVASSYLETLSIDYSLVSIEETGSRCAVIMAGHGCQYSCKFCIEHLYWPKNRMSLSSANVRNELLDLSKLGVKTIGCGDSCIDMRSSDFADFCSEAFAGIELQEHFYILTRLNMIAKEGCIAYRNSGGRAVWVGLETASKDLLVAMGKQDVAYNVKEQLSIAKQCDIRTGAFFLFGFPGETHDTARATIRFIEELFAEELIDYVDPSIFVPYPGLTMYTDPMKYGLNPHSSWEDWDNWGRYNSKPVFGLDTLSRDEIFKFWQEAIQIRNYNDLRIKSSSPGE